MVEPTCRPLEIIFQNQHLVALYKPALLHSERRRDDTDDTLAARFAARFPDAADLAARWEDAGLLQRLDFETSGVVFAALGPTGRERFLKQQRAGEIDKTYVALLDGKLSQTVSINAHTGSPYRKARKVKVYSQPPRKKERARPAFTEIKPLKYFPEADASLVRCVIQSGSRHQIRAHSAYAGYPLLGDELYGSSTSLAAFIEHSLNNRLSVKLPFFLHAAAVRLAHTATEEELLVSAPFPDYCTGIVNDQIFLPE